MIFYFSGTGNTRYVAKKLSSILREEVQFIPSTEICNLQPHGKNIGIMFPVYSWGVPPIVLDFIGNLSSEFIKGALEANIKFWAVCTCGDETGNAISMLKKKFRSRGVEIAGVWSVIMPNNYVLLPGFDVDSKEIEIEKIDRSEDRIIKIAKDIFVGHWHDDFTEGSLPKSKTALVYPLFKRWGIFPNRWKTDENCVSCGKCASVCPVNNIEMLNGKPQWHDCCVSCLACYHYCPVKAVNYGKITQRKGQYHFPAKE